MPILEKAYSKAFVNYETIGYGWMSESARVLTGAPSYRYTSSSQSESELWDILKKADDNKYVLTAASMDGLYGLAKGHAYSLIGVYEIKSSTGSIVERLVHMRNPWKSESYNGPWRDGDSIWTTAYKAQVPYKSGNDGNFFIPLSYFKSGFSYYTLTYYKDDFEVSYYEKEGFSVGSTYNYAFSLSKSQDAFIGADVYPDRMYPPGGNCRGTTSGVIRLFKGSTRLGQTYISSSDGFGYVFKNLAAGDYSIQVQISRVTHSTPVNDFTVRVYAAEKVKITDSSGRTSFDSVLTFSDGQTIPLEGGSKSYPAPDTETSVEEEPVPPTIEVPKEDLTKELQDFISQVAVSTSGFKYIQPKSYYSYLHKYDSVKDRYYFQLKSETTKYNLDFKVQFYAISSELVSSESDIVADKSNTG